MSSKQYFEEVAGDWDTMREGFFTTKVREKAYALAGVEKGRAAADIGAGTGFITEGLLGAGLSVIAVDQSQAMLEEMRGKFGAAKRLDLRLGTAGELPIADQSVEYSFANMYLHHVPDPAAAIREMARILKPGGTLVITDLDEHRHEFLRTEHHDLWMGFKRSDVERWFTEAGLRDIRIESVGESCSSQCSCSSSKEEASISIWAAAGRRA
jgi:ubiquinone/menaquinone biosynthesis C-methylase UbiE